jgi:hypothetical protein
MLKCTPSAPKRERNARMRFFVPNIFLTVCSACPLLAQSGHCGHHAASLHSGFLRDNFSLLYALSFGVALFAHAASAQYRARFINECGVRLSSVHSTQVLVRLFRPFLGVKRTRPLRCKCPLLTQSGHRAHKRLRYTMMVSRVFTGVFIWPFAGA